MGSFLWKLKPGLWTYGLVSPLKEALGAYCPKLVFRPQTLIITALESDFFFMSSFIKLCMKKVLVFKFWVIFDKVMIVSAKIAKKPFKILLFGAIRLFQKQNKLTGVEDMEFPRCTEEKGSAFSRG